MREGQVPPPPLQGPGTRKEGQGETDRVRGKNKMTAIILAEIIYAETQNTHAHNFFQYNFLVFPLTSVITTESRVLNTFLN